MASMKSAFYVKNVKKGMGRVISYLEGVMILFTFYYYVILN